MDRKKIEKLKRDQLVSLCKEKGLYAKGKKKDLIVQLCTKNIFSTMKNKNYILQHLKDDLYIFPNMGWVFNKNTNAIVGKIDLNDEIVSLTKDELQKTKTMGFLFEIPVELHGDLIQKKSKKLEDFFSDDEEQNDAL